MHELMKRLLRSTKGDIYVSGSTEFCVHDYDAGSRCRTGVGTNRGSCERVTLSSKSLAPFERSVQHRSTDIHAALSLCNMNMEKSHVSIE